MGATIGSSARKGSSLEYIEGSMPVDPAALHHEVHLRRGGNILQRISRHRDDVGLLARRRLHRDHRAATVPPRRLCPPSARARE